MEQHNRNKEFRALADSFITLANTHCDQVESNRVGSALMYAASRFSAFVVSSHSSSREQFEAEIDNAVDFFSKEFKRMLSENMVEYKSVFKAQPRYQHLMKKENASKKESER